VSLDYECGAKIPEGVFAYNLWNEELNELLKIFAISVRIFWN